MPDFPNELVEAAAVLLDGMTCERCDGEGYIEIHDPNAAHADNPDGSHDEYCPDCCASGRAGFRKAAALIEQRVIDRLAAQAGTNPYADADSVDFDPFMRDGWYEGAACGVAAERERCVKVLRDQSYAEGNRLLNDPTVVRTLIAAAELIERSAAISSPAEPDTGEGA